MVQENALNFPPLLVVVGATSSGKSRFAETLAPERGGEILNADSQQFYRGFDIGTGKTPLEERNVPQHLLDLCEPGDFLTAAEFARRADSVVSNLRERKVLPILVGGTGLYIRSFLEGLDQLPSRDEVLRSELRRRFEEEGGQALHRELGAVDPASAAKIHPQDPVRLIRYLEIYRLTGQVPSELMKNRRPERLRYPAHIYWLSPARERLRLQIEARVRDMFRRGWVEEVETLLKRGIDPRRLQNKPIGYAEIADHLSTASPLEKTVEAIILRTQQYAKRQETFFRGLLALKAYHSHGSAVERITA